MYAIGSVQIDWFYYNSSYTVLVGDTVQDVANDLGNQLQGTFISQFGACEIITFSVSAAGDLTLTIDVKYYAGGGTIFDLLVNNSSNKFALGSGNYLQHF